MDRTDSFSRFKAAQSGREKDARPEEPKIIIISWCIVWMAAEVVAVAEMWNVCRRGCVMPRTESR